MLNESVYMGTSIHRWNSHKSIKTITFSITDDCNLRCTYCYFTHKTHKNAMSFDTAKKAVDDILSEELYSDYDGAVWEFIGGEPTLMMDLIDEISDYILYRMYKLNHKWLYCYRFMIGTNGLLYDSVQVQNYILKHKNNLYIAITIDGSKEKHNLSRVKADGSGSYDDIIRNIPQWQKQFGGISTKSTFAHEDIKYLKDSIVNLWNLGIKNVSANVVFEDVWSDEDPKIYKTQLYELADYIIENDLWNDVSVRFFSHNVGLPYDEEYVSRNFCGTGSMLAVNTEGDYYPCVRFMPSSANNNNFPKLGSIKEKINPDKLRPFYILNTLNQSSERCIRCDVAGGCTWCSGFNYDESSIGTLFERQTNICEMHKANVEVNKYLWRQYELIKHKISPYRYKKITSISPFNKFMYIICDDEFPSFCGYTTSEKNGRVVMNEDMLVKALGFCDENNYIPILCGCNKLPSDYYAHRMVTYSEYITEKDPNSKNYFTQVVMGVEEFNKYGSVKFDSTVVGLIISVNTNQLDELKSIITSLFEKNSRLNINIAFHELRLADEMFLKNYKNFLDKLLDIIENSWVVGKYVTVGSITNELFANRNRYCGAGENNYSICPDGRIYLCPGFYYSSSDHVGDLQNGIDNIYSKYCDMNNAPLCKTCSIRHCKRCVWSNKSETGEYHIPTELQCVMASIETEYTQKLKDWMVSNNIDVPFDYNTRLKKPEFYDPLYAIREDKYPNHGYESFLRNL